MENRENKAISCTVNQCANHSSNGNYCSLSTIKIGTHEASPCQCECTDCMSFVKK